MTGAGVNEKRQRVPLSSRVVALAAFTASWTGVAFGELKLTDILLAIATGLLFLDLGTARSVHIGFWTWMPFLGALLVLTVDTFVRNEGTAEGSLTCVRLLFGTFLVALLVRTEVDLGGLDRMFRLIKWFSAGVIVNAVAADLVGRGFLNLRGFVLQQPDDWRLSGLAFHPNSLALSLSLAMPALVFLVFRPETSRQQRVLWAVGLAECTHAIFLADSRGGLLCGLSSAVIALSLVFRESQFRRFALPFAGAALAAIYVWIVPLLQNTRLAHGEGSASDLGRASNNAQGISQFLENPFFGAGLAHPIGVAVPLELLSSGGLALFGSYFVFVVVLLRHLLVRPITPFARFGLLALATMVAFGLTNPGATERASFWVPLLLMAGVQNVRLGGPDGRGTAPRRALGQFAASRSRTRS